MSTDTQPACVPGEGAEDMSFMGTMEEARARFLVAVDLWTSLRQPLIAGASEHKKREVQEREVQFRLANEAAFIAWHMRASPTDASDLAAARAELAKEERSHRIAANYVDELRTELAAARKERDALRAALIEDTIEACKECGWIGFPKRSDCDGCTSAVDERISDLMSCALAADGDGHA